MSQVLFDLNEGPFSQLFFIFRVDLYIVIHVVRSYSNICNTNECFVCNNSN